MDPKTRRSTANTNYHALEVTDGPSERELAALDAVERRWEGEEEDWIGDDPSEDDERRR